LSVRGAADDANREVLRAAAAGAPGRGQRLQRRTWQQALAGGAVERPPVERPARPGERRLSGVSCTGASLCVAVGSVIENRQDVKAAKQPRGASGTVLNGVSCTATSFCMAVGSDNSGEANVAEAWNGAARRSLKTVGLSPGCWRRPTLRSTATRRRTRARARFLLRQPDARQPCP